MAQENKVESKVEENVMTTLLANEVVGNKAVTLDFIEGTISQEGKDDIVYHRYRGEITSLDSAGKTLVNYIKDDKGKSHKVPVVKEFSIPKEAGDLVAKAIMSSL